MASSKIDFRGQAFAKVLGFAAGHWRRQPKRIAFIVALFFTETVADILTPFFAGRLVEAVASGAATNEIAWNAAITAFLDHRGARRRLGDHPAARLPADHLADAAG